MKRVIVDYAKLTNEILTLLVERFPDGYDDKDIIRFKNANNETVEAVEVRTEDTIFLVKVSTKLADRIENFDDDDQDDVIHVLASDNLDSLKELEIDDEPEFGNFSDETNEPFIEDVDSDYENSDLADLVNKYLNKVKCSFVVNYSCLY